MNKIKHIYCDLDDTLIINNKVNEEILSFLYKCNNNKLNIYLITRHKSDPLITLDNYCISKKLFNGGIIHITNRDDMKCNYILHNSLLIDDSFRERYDTSILYNKEVYVADIDIFSSTIYNI